MKPLSDKAIIESWRHNVEPWVKAVRNGEIISRIEVTNQAILDAILKYRPSNVLDVGCGEGWLIRALGQAGIACTGMDGVSAFSAYIEGAGARFLPVTYEDFEPQTLPERFDVVVCNFSLLGKEVVEHLISRLPHALKPQGVLIVQTLHPLVASTQDQYVDGWRVGSWQGFSEEFADPPPWYFRTIESWQRLFSQNGFQQLALSEPSHPESGTRMSIIFEVRHGGQ